MWINKNTNEVFKMHSEIRSAFKGISLPPELTDEVLASIGLSPITQIPKPKHDFTKNVTEGTPVQQNGVWTQVWNVTDASSEEIAERIELQAESVREERDKRLAETDFYGLSDVNMSAEIKTYRQALRDITTHANFPHLNDEDWPTKPEELVIESNGTTTTA